MADIASTSHIEQSIAPSITTTIPSDASKPISNRLLGRYKSLQLVRKPSKIKTGEIVIGSGDPIESVGTRTSKDDFHLLRLKQWPPPTPSTSASTNSSTSNSHVAIHGGNRGSYTAPSSPTSSHHHHHHHQQQHNNGSISPTPHPTPSSSTNTNASPPINPNPTSSSINPSSTSHLTPSNSLSFAMSTTMHPTTSITESNSVSAPYIVNCLEDLLQNTSSQQHQILSLIHTLDPQASIPVRSCLPSSSHLCFLHNRVLDLRHLVDSLTLDLLNLKTKNSQLQKQLNAYLNVPGSSNAIKKGVVDHHSTLSLSRQSSLNFDLPPHLAVVGPSATGSSNTEAPNTSSSSS